MKSINRGFIFSVLFTFFTGSAFSQLYFADRSNVYYFADLKKDSAHIEIFKDDIYFVFKSGDEVLEARIDAGGVLFGWQNKIIKQKNRYYLLYKDPLANKLTKVELKPCVKDVREGLRKEAYYCLKSRELSRLQDSLAGPGHRSYYSLNQSTDSTSSVAYFKMTDEIMDSLTKMIRAQADLTALNFYSNIDSLSQMKQTEIFGLLKKARYDFYYGKCLLYNVALTRPEVLISYIDKNYPNKIVILKTIRDHEYFRMITSKVKAAPVQTYGKSEIVKQKRKRVIRDKAGKATLAGLIVAEVALIAALIIFALRL